MKRSLRAEARAARAPTYLTGEPCAAGHVSPRRTSSGTCIACEKARSMARRGNKRYLAHVRKQYAAGGARWRASTLNNIARRAKEVGVPFDRVAVKSLLWNVPATCEVLGIELSIEHGTVDTSPSVDRRIPALGYVAGNMRIISGRANRLKSDGTSEELRTIADWIDAGT